MELKGDLSHQALADILQAITFSGKEGTLVVDDGKSRREIYFSREGIRLFSTGNRKGMPLGELLVKRKIIDQSQLSQALSVQKTTDLKLGEVLCHLGYIKSGDLERIVHNQIENEIYDIFIWSGAKFEFIEGPPPTAPLISEDNPVAILPVDVNALIESINRRNQEWEKVKDLFNNHNSIFKLTDDYEDKLSEIRLSEDEQLVFRVISGFKTLSDIIEESTLDAFETYKAIHGLKERQIIREISPEEVKNYARQLRREKKFDQALFFFQQAHKFNASDWAISEDIAEILEILERPSEAGLKYKDLGKILEAKKDINLAAIAYKKALALLPADEEVYASLFNLLVLQGQNLEAAGLGKQLIKIQAKSKRISEIILLAKKIATLTKNDFELRAHMAAAYFQAGEYSKSKSEIDEAIKELPVQDNGALIAAYEKILSIEPRHSDARYRLDSLLKVQMGRKKKTKKLLIVAASFLVFVLAGGLFAFRDYMAYKEFLLVKKEADEVKGRGEYESALLRYRAFPHALTLYTRAAVQKESTLVSELVANKEDKIISAVRSELDRLTKIYQDSLIVKQRDGDFDRALTMMKDVASKTAEFMKGIGQKVFSMGGSVEIAEKQSQNYGKFLDSVRSEVSDTEKYLKQADDLYAAIQDLDRMDRLDEVAKSVSQLIKNYPGARVAKSAKIPVMVKSIPPSAEVSVGGKRQGRTPCKIYLPYNESAEVILTKNGFSPYSRQVKSYEQSLISVVLEKAARWAVDTGTALYTGPMLLGDTVFLTTRKGYLMSFDAKNGQLKWSFRTDNQTEIHSAPKSNQGMVLFGADDNNIYAVRSTAALKVFQLKTAAPVRASAFFSPDGKTILIGGADKNLYAIDEKGSALWKYPANARISNSGVVVGSVVYIPSDDGILHAVNLNDGSALWNLPLGGKLTDPVVSKGLIFLGGANNMVSAVNMSTGKVQWTYRMKREVSASLAASGDLILTPCQDGILYALDITTQKPAWQFETKGSLSGGAVVSAGDGVAYLGSEDGRLYAIKISDGRELWSYKTKGRIRASPAVGADVVYVAGDDGFLHAVEK